MVLEGSVVDRVSVDGSEVKELAMGSQLLLPKLAEKLPSHNSLHQEELGRLENRVSLKRREQKKRTYLFVIKNQGMLLEMRPRKNQNRMKRMKPETEKPETGRMKLNKK